MVAPIAVDPRLLTRPSVAEVSPRPYRGQLPRSPTMPSSRLPFLGALLVALTVMGCTMLVPAERLEPGWRRFTIAVDTIGTDRPAILLVADDAGRTVGRAVPSIVAPHKHEQVTFDVPPGRSWRIFVSGEVLIFATDARVPIAIFTGGPSGANVQWTAPSSVAP